MCGIAGIVTHTPVDAAALNQMVKAMHHRGPDDSGCLEIEGPDVRLLLGNARLSIMDLSPAGHQPMRDRSTGNVVVVNGEIYNHPEVRREIGDRAGAWHSTGDTETLLKAWSLWGPDCLSRLRGMFAAALWDPTRGSLWLMRDRMGIKPLYYFASSGTFAFASETRALVASGLVPKRLDTTALAAYVRFGSVIEPNTLIEGVRSLPAGHCMEIRGGSPEGSWPYWNLDTSACTEPLEETVAGVRAHLERSMKEHLLSDVPVGCFLSGGIDSSVVTALASRASELPLRTFTIAFPSTGIDESSYATEVAERYHSQHHSIILTPQDVVQMVPDAVRAMDLPSADGVNTYLVARAAAGAVKVVLSGLGGDELFAGYPSFRALTRAQRFSRFGGPWTRRLAQVMGLRDGAALRFSEMTGRGIPLPERYASLRSFWSLSQCEKMGLGRPPGYPCGIADSALPVASQISALELSGYMRSTLLRDGDAMSMASSLEVRFPFLDHLLVEFSLRSGAAVYGVRQRSKEILLAATADLLPVRVVQRAKQGFTLPMGEWMQGPLRDYSHDGIRAVVSSRALPGIDLGELQKLFDAGRLSWARLWEFVVLGHWMDRVISQP